MTPPTIGRYRIVGTLGEGGMGTVYEAVQDHPNRTVALKVIRADHVSPELIRRFEFESEVLGRLQHPGIAQIYEAGTAIGPDGTQSFFAMELVRGQSLTGYAESRGLDVQQRLDLFARICDAVHYAHQQGVIHRDLKPANILVDASGQPKILDFGVARLTNADEKATSQTTAGRVLGTLQYMSPEQVNADPMEVDTRSDVYSLGVILYELMSGKLPYDLTKKMIYEAARVIMVDDPTPLSSINQRLAGDVEIIVGKALEKERERRYDSAAALANDIRRFLHDEPILARPASAIYQLQKFARRNRALVGGVVLAASMLVVGAGVSLWQAVRARAAEQLAESRRGEAVAAQQLAESRRSEAVAAGQLAERRRALADSALEVADVARATALKEQAAAVTSALRATGEAQKAQAINTFLQEMLASADPYNAKSKDLTVRELLDQAGTRTHMPTLAGQPAVKAAVEHTIGQTYFGLGLLDQARTHLDSAYSIRRRTFGAQNLELAESADELARLATSLGDYKLADQRMTEALATMRITLKPDDDRVTSAMEALAYNRYRSGKLVQAESLYRASLALTRKRHPDGGLEVAARLKAYGAFLSFNRRTAEALPLLEEAVAILRRAHGPNHPAVVDVLINLSDVHANSRGYAAAEKTLREALPTARAIFGPEHLDVANILARLGNALYEQRKLEEAEPIIRDGLAMRIKLLGEQHLDVQVSRTELARLVQANGRYAEAESLLTRALATRRSALGNDHAAVAASLMDLGMLANAQGQWGRSEQRLREAHPIWRAAGVPDQELYTLAQLATALLRQQKLDEADTILADVLQRRRALFGDDNWSIGDTYERMADLATARRQYARAESLAVLTLGIRRKAFGPRSPQVAFQLYSVAQVADLRGDSSAAIPRLREALSIVSTRPPTDAFVIAAHRALAVDLCTTGAAAEGDSVIRIVIPGVPLDSTKIPPYRLRSVLGFCLTRERRFAEAESVLLQSEAALRALATPATPYWKATVAWLVSLYEQWGKNEQASLWRTRLAGS